MNRTAGRVGQAVAAGALLAVGIGLGAYNAWWLTLLVGVPLIAAGLISVPRPSQLSVLDVFEGGAPRRPVPVRVDALTRSSRSHDDLQPTLVTATISPPHDTEYQGRWIISMSRGDFEALTEKPVTALAPDQLPPREAMPAPQFHRPPGPQVLSYSAVTVVVALALLFGVGDAWRISLDRPTPPAPREAQTAPGPKEMNLNARLRGMIEAVSNQFGPAAANNLLELRFTGSGSDYGTVLDPTNGDTTIVYVNNNGDAFTTPSAQVLRKDSTFTAGDIATADLTAITHKMDERLDSAGGHVDLDTLEIERSRPGGPVILTGTFGGKTVKALPDGTVGEIFDPADFAVSFQRARNSLALAGITPSDRVLTNFEIRGTHRATPIAHASELQTRGGVLLEFQTEDRSGQIVIVPGELPEVTQQANHFGSQTFSFDDVSPQVFESVRAQAMQRGALEPYEREAVHIWMTDREIDPYRLAIRIELAGVEAATGTYSVTGEFLAPDAV